MSTKKDFQTRIEAATQREQQFRATSRDLHQAGDLDGADLAYVEALVWAVRAQDLRDELADLEELAGPETLPAMPHEGISAMHH